MTTGEKLGVIETISGLLFATLTFAETFISSAKVN
jgi:hypothetical protein